MFLRVFPQRSLQPVDRLLQVLLLPGEFRLLRRARRRRAGALPAARFQLEGIQLGELGDQLLKLLLELGDADVGGTVQEVALAQLVEKRGGKSLGRAELPALLHYLVYEAALLRLETGNVLLQQLVFPVVVLKIRIHSLDISLHGRNIVVFRIDLRLKLLDLVVEDKLELLQFLILLFELVNFLFFVVYCFVPLSYFFQVVIPLSV
mmetsp:Transcript_12173/g.29520  ORF Transcript_12173/g.29520 Transcript_12173/m.29520 type:complete len:206 (-) Transcript_12173:244-861(-)